MDVQADRSWLASRIRDVPDFPSAGVTFKDVTPLLADHEAFVHAVDAFAGFFADERIDAVVGIEARGFILAAPIAYRFGAGFLPARKAGKLPGPTRAVSYSLEYGQETLEVHQDAIAPGDRVLIVDDVLATGGTASAAIELVQAARGEVVGLGFLIELLALGGGSKLAGHDRLSLLEY